jgi:hypothetical protein
MKNVVLSAILLFFTACSNPLLKWIDTSGGTRTVSRSDKAISSFSFGIEGESVLIRTDSDGDGRTPITVVLPANNDLAYLEPRITFIGKSLSPRSGEPRDFNSPVMYRVTAEDDSFRDYVVQVYVKNSLSNAIIWFDLEIPKAGEHILAEGVVIENPVEGEQGEIIIHVPSGTNPEALTAHIVQTGVSVRTPNGRLYPETAITLTGNFSVPEIYTVQAENGAAREYRVTVLMDKGNSKEIQAFSFAGLENSQSVIIGAVPQPDGKIPIVVTIPPPASRSSVELLSDLTPVITHSGVSIAGSGIPAGGSGTVGAVSPVNFNSPVTYTVQAEDGSIRDYTVKVYVFDRNTSKQITGFYFIFPNSPAEGAAGIINETAKTIAVTVPSGTDLRSLSPVVYHTGVSVSPISGAPEDFRDSVVSPLTYTVTARDGSSQDYKVSVFIAKDSSGVITNIDFGIPNTTVAIGSTPGADGKLPIVITVSDPDKPIDLSTLIPEITHTGVSITGDGIPAGGSGTVTGTPVDFTGPVNYTVQAEDGTTQDYTITVINASDSPSPAPSPSDPSWALAEIETFYFNNPLVMGVIDQGAKTIRATVPYNTNLRTLTPTIHFSGKSIRLGTGPEHDTSPAVIGADFSNSGSVPVTYTVSARDGVTSVPYQVTVTAETKPPGADNQITALAFAQIPAAATTTVIGSAPDAGGRIPIEVTVPVSTNLSALTPVITHTGVSISGGGLPDGGPGTVTGVPADFGSPVPYTVKAENGATRDYLVTLRAEDNNAKVITGFYFTDPLAVGEIDEGAKTITVLVPYGTNLEALKPTVYYTGVSLNPVSGRVNAFTFPAVYTVTARNGTVQPYTVRVSARQSSTKDITGFSFPGVAAFDTIIGAVPGPDGKIPIAITVSDRTNIAALTPSISHTGKTISPGPGAAGNFSGPVSYRVTAEDGSTKDYSVSVHLSGNSSKVISGFSFTSIPAVGQVDQEAHTIEVAVPHSAAPLIGSLAPTITYIGASIGVSGAAPQSVHPFTDASRDFSNTASNPLVYTVTAADGTTQDYRVRVSVEEQNLSFGVSFLGISDADLISESFDQNTGLLTIQVNPRLGYTDPYEWYLDGRRYPVSATEPVLILQTGGLRAGQHEVVVVVTGTDRLHYTNKVYFLVHE